MPVDDFEAPVQNNPDGAEAEYSPGDITVAEADAQTGAVKIKDDGVVIITATGKESDACR